MKLKYIASNEWQWHIKACYSCPPSSVLAKKKSNIKEKEKENPWHFSSKNREKTMATLSTP